MDLPGAVEDWRSQALEWVGLVAALSEFAKRQMGVNLGRLDISVAHHCLALPGIDVVFGQLSAEQVPECMGVAVLDWHAGALAVPLNQLIDCTRSHAPALALILMRWAGPVAGADP